MADEPLCDWCRYRSSDGKLNGDPCCLSCADGLIFGDGLDLATEHAIEERSRKRRSYYRQVDETQTGWIWLTTEIKNPRQQNSQ